VNVGIVIQARLGSTRLPAKILKPLQGKTVLEYCVDNMRSVRGIGSVVVATTTSEQDDSLVDFCGKKKIDFFRGSETNVLERYVHAAEAYRLDAVVRITSDCPFSDPFVVEDVLKTFLSKPCDLASNVIDRTYPRGLDTEIVRTECLKELLAMHPDSFYLEHVTPYFYEHPEKYKLISVTAEAKLRHPEYRICIDTPEDYELLKKIASHLPTDQPYRAEQIVDLFDQNPAWKDINAHVFHLKHKGKT